MKFYGANAEKEKLGEVYGEKCLKCGSPIHIFFLFRTYFYIFNIPFISLINDELAICKKCGNVKKITQMNEYSKLKMNELTENVNFPVKHFLGLICIILITIILFLFIGVSQT